jgi:hypothetical protein
MSSLRALHTSLKGQTASATWCVLSQDAQESRDYGFTLPTSNLIAKPEVGI